MQTVKTKTFKSGNSQAVRLPKGFAYPDGTELEMVKEGNVIRIRPTCLTFEEAVELMKTIPGPGSIEIRDTEDIPERNGL